MKRLPEDERWARVAWSYLAEPETAAACAAVARHGPLEALRLLTQGRLSGPGLQAAAGRATGLDLDRVPAALRTLGVRVVVPGDPEWPESLGDLAHPPFCLYVRGAGRLDELGGQAVAVVGARAATAYGTQVARELGRDLAHQGWTVVSGAALGIDGAAHRGSLDGGGAGVAVLACGLDRTYPPQHTDLVARIAEDGAVVSELPLGAAPYPSRFLARNRVIAALALGVVVVEAGLRSGARNTARLAGELAREVLAVPGPVFSAQSAGCHELIRSGQAVLVTRSAEVVEVLSPMGQGLLPIPRALPDPVADLSPAQRQVLSAVPHRERVGTDELVRRSGVDVRDVLAALTVLEDLDLVRRGPDGWRKTPAGPGGGESRHAGR